MRALIASFTPSHSSLDSQDSSGRTALHWAAAHEHDAVVQALIAAGANTQLKDNKGQIASDGQHTYEQRSYRTRRALRPVRLSTLTAACHRCCCSMCHCQSVVVDRVQVASSAGRRMSAGSAWQLKQKIELSGHGGMLQAALHEPAVRDIAVSARHDAQ